VNFVYTAEQEEKLKVKSGASELMPLITQKASAIMISALTQVRRLTAWLA